MALRDEVMGWVKAMPLMASFDLAGRWYLLEGEEPIDPVARDQIIELREGSIIKGGKVAGRYVVADRHLEIALDEEPVIFLWQTPETFLVGAQEFHFEEDDPYRVRLVMDRVPQGREEEPELLPQLEEA